MIPKYERPAAPVAGQYPRVRQINEGHTVDIAWQNFFTDDRLKKLIELSLTNNLDLRVTVLKVKQSRTRTPIARAKTDRVHEVT